MRFWIDIDNPPQVQYMMPLAERIQDSNESVLLTCRDYGVTIRLLEERGAAPRVVGRESGSGTIRKAAGVLGRTARLVHEIWRDRRIDAVISSSRSAALAAYLMRIPSFAILDYEYVELGVFRRAGTTVVHPDVIPSNAFTDRGFPVERLVRFEGLKEDLTFSDRDPASVQRHAFGLPPGRRVVLFRPPSEHSHYFTSGSRGLAVEVLQHLAREAGSTTVVSPRHPHQVADVQSLRWQNAPVILEDPLPFDELLASADLVVCAGGTMLREAAWLGVPAISIFQSRMGAVDLALQREGRIAHASSLSEFVEAAGRLRTRLPHRRVHGVVDDILGAIRSRAAERSRRS